jgi:hypothetical protein
MGRRQATFDRTLMPNADACPPPSHGRGWGPISHQVHAERILGPKRALFVERPSSGSLRLFPLKARKPPSRSEMVSTSWNLSRVRPLAAAANWEPPCARRRRVLCDADGSARGTGSHYAQQPLEGSRQMPEATPEFKQLLQSAFEAMQVGQSAAGRECPPTSASVRLAALTNSDSPGGPGPA